MDYFTFDLIFIAIGDVDFNTTDFNSTGSLKKENDRPIDRFSICLSTGKN